MMPPTKKNSYPVTLFLFGGLFFFFAQEASAQSIAFDQRQCSFHWRLAVCRPASFRSAGKTYAEMAEERQRAFLVSEARRRATAWPTEFVKITDHLKNPNSVKIPFAQAPEISVKTRKVNGRRVCEDKNDKGNKSKQKGKDVHIDKECCLDPDEVPNPLCYYPQLGANNSPGR